MVSGANSLEMLTIMLPAERTYNEPKKWMRGKGRVTIQFGCCYNYALVFILVKTLLCYLHRISPKEELRYPHACNALGNTDEDEACPWVHVFDMFNEVFGSANFFFGTVVCSCKALAKDVD